MFSKQELEDLETFLDNITFPDPEYAHPNDRDSIINDIKERNIWVKRIRELLED